ncbi:right-handed parallel beta-helix repeat-containing protein [Paenibacillus sp. LHD-117]|uniref:right-handed parallel beta-helix repeat-containing protein n=1 Tax=Paenibacillus sp. LHD-117 TaxID=3071412 RepID=UPI0027E0EFFB|nr:right-handed parallel beta-helix repeat-containing protein [Paenibacillus sp. LHD-117]MDQ6421440.1 right-handed parallel beta-helix repeat-containing protein [Paenibacillus sp. LHD-117]
MASNRWGNNKNERKDVCMLKRLLSIVLAVTMTLTMFGLSAANVQAETLVHGNIQAEIFVSPTGNDANPGTYEQPLATLDGARKAVAKINSNMTGDIYVFFAAGEYYMTNTVEFGVADSGTNGHDIIYREMDGLDTVHFIGGEKVDPNSWTLVNGTVDPTADPDGDLPDSISGMVYKSFVGTGDYPSKNFNTLYVNDTRQMMARSPNLNKRPDFPSSFSDYYRTTGGGAGGSNVTSMTFNDSILDVDTRNGMIHAMARGDFDAQVFTDDYGGDRHWESNTLMLSSYTTGKFTFKTDPEKPEFNRPRFTVGHHSSFFVQGNLGFLDQPGEFYYNKKTGYLYYYPTEDITQLDVIIPKVETIVLLKGNDKDNTVHNIQFNGIKFADTNFPDWYSPYWNWGDTGTGMGKYPPEAMNSTNPSYAEGVDRPQFQVGIIKMNYASYINIERAHIKNGGMNGISLYLANHNITIRDSLIEHVGHDGIQIEGGYPGDPINGGMNGEGYSRDNLIENSIIHDVGELVLCSAGISMNNAGRNTVRHVEIYNSPRRGLLLQAGNARNPNNVGGFGDKFLNRYNDFYIHNNRFEYVYVHDTQQDGGDDGSLFVGWIYRGSDPEPNYKRNYFEQVIIDQTASNPTMTNYTPNNINTDMGANGLSFKNVMSTNSQNFNFEGGSYFQSSYGDKALISDNTNLNYGPAYDQDPTFDPSKMELDKIGVTAAYPAEYKSPLVATDKPTDIYFEDSFEDKEIDVAKWSYQNKLPKTTTLYMAGTPLQDSRSLMLDYSGAVKPVLYREFPQALNKVVSIKMFDPFAINPTGYDSGRPFNMKNFYTMTRADDGENSRGIGINANSGSANFNHYVLNIDGVEQATTVQRSNGWHELKWDYTGTGVTMYIDNVQVYQDVTALPFDYLQLGSPSGTGASWLDQVYVYGGTPAPALGSIPMQAVPAYDASSENKTRLDLNFEDGVVPSFSLKGGIAPVLSVIADPADSSNKVMQTVIGDGQSYYQTGAPWNNYIVNMKWKFVGWGSTNILNQAYDNFTIYINTNGTEPNPPAYQVIYRRNKGGVTGFDMLPIR